MNTNISIYDAIDESKKRYYGYKKLPEDDNETHLRAVVDHYKDICMAMRL